MQQYKRRKLKATKKEANQAKRKKDEKEISHESQDHTVKENVIFSYACTVGRSFHTLVAWPVARISHNLFEDIPQYSFVDAISCNDGVQGMVYR